MLSALLGFCFAISFWFCLSPQLGGRLLSAHLEDSGSCANGHLGGLTDALWVADGASQISRPHSQGPRHAQHSSAFRISSEAVSDSRYILCVGPRAHVPFDTLKELS